MQGRKNQRGEAQTRHQGGPFALDAEGRVASPWTAPAGDHYSCMACSERVIVRRGAVRRAHFAHLPESTRTVSYESIEHAAFKRLLVQGLRLHQKFVRNFTCLDCRLPRQRPSTILPGARIDEEVVIGSFRADVGVVRDGRPVLAFEVYVTHEVGEDKGRRLAVPWIEVLGQPEEIVDLAKVPKVQVKDSNLMEFSRCPPCVAEAARQAQLKAEQQRRSARAQKALDRLRGPDAQEPAHWLTPFSLEHAAYRAPVDVVVQGVRFLMHPVLLPNMVLSQDDSGSYAFRSHALRFTDPSGHERYRSAQLGRILEDLLAGRLTATPEGRQLLAELAPLVEGLSVAREKPEDDAGLPHRDGLVPWVQAGDIGRAMVIRRGPIPPGTNHDVPKFLDRTELDREWCAELGVRLIQEAPGRWAARTDRYPHLVGNGGDGEEAQRHLLDAVLAEESDWRNAIVDSDYFIYND